MVFLHILDDFKYANTFIKVLCSHGLNISFIIGLIRDDEDLKKCMKTQGAESFTATLAKIPVFRKILEFEIFFSNFALRIN